MEDSPGLTSIWDLPVGESGWNGSLALPAIIVPKDGMLSSAARACDSVLPNSLHENGQIVGIVLLRVLQNDVQ